MCAAHPELAGELRVLHARHSQWRSVFGRLASVDLRRKLDEGLDSEAAARREADASARLGKLRLREADGARYKLMGEIGRGGMGAVVKVWDEQLGRALAMKVVLGKEDAASQGGTPPVDQRTLGRFLDEAQLTGRLDHPGIVPVHELGLGADGQVYFTMRLVQGEDLLQVFRHVREGRDEWTLPRALGVLLKVCEAMSYAHDRGVIHRDLKPSNIMVGKYGEVYVMDWGLARDLSSAEEPAAADAEPAEADAERTLDGEVLGTPSYMSPEQARGELARLGPRSDIYSAGAMLYQLLASGAVEAPFVPKGERATQRVVLQRVLAGPPPPLERLAPSVPPELAAIVEKAMARAAEERYASMRELAHDLRAFLEGQVVAAYETGAWAEARKWVGRNRALTGAIASALLALVAGTLVSLRLADEAQANEQAAVAANRELDQRNLALEAQARDLRLRGLLQDLSRFRAESRAIAEGGPVAGTGADWWLARATELVRGRAGGGDGAWQPGLRDVEAKLAELRAGPDVLAYGDADRAADHATHPAQNLLRELEAQLEAARKDAGAEGAQLAAKIEWQRRMLGLEAWPDEARAAEEVASPEYGKTPEQLDTQAWKYLGFGAQRQYGRELHALALMRRAVDTASGGDRPVRLNSLAVGLLQAGKFDEALRTSEQSVASAPQHLRATFESNAARIRTEVAFWSAAQRADREAELARDESELAAVRERARVASEARQAAVQARIDEVRLRCAERRTWRYSTSSAQWWHDQLRDVREQLAALEALLVPAEQALRSPAAREAWRAAFASIAASPRYAGAAWPGGTLAPQLGLLPLGENPATGLWEFLHMQSGVAPAAGADGKPSRDEHGGFVLAPETGIVFVLLPGGRMSAEQGMRPDLAYLHPEFQKLELAPYFLAAHELTQAQWDRLSAKPWLHGEPLGPLLPANNMNWPDAMDTLRRMAGFAKLPTAAQWEYACRAGTSTPWWTGDKPESLRGIENVRFAGQADAATRPVGAGRGNPYGFHDLHGNVWEWCADAYIQAFERPPLVSRPGDGLRDRDTTGFRVIRGGSAGYSPDEARAVFFTALPVAHHSPDVGLRVALPVTR